ncbi:2-hydroxychromene-2-carboxylate isomerase [Paracoccus denitrificans]|jgi:2-hydroxychromene-2-carboxylate isomerase|uniref:2-hydroxychromene-2-carboxylate isomerase n=1 Tax=Paracoccus denitrificans (strain Pd 1222) TaxID=318586 RepID=A1B215_PARDP|nr:2-hydroxychromene-2-carboxylate isomerase [Paracoccus denitrificans]ABL69559.1 DSBA oxidoreductase [Paracoccus denitrificans PD1222]MBB4626807.1 2-hydroxychromene-2-carboxylate isomerase [Paracoccus denitrificans]MCU7427710.1 2-hydroxychromene-2-carboxylate isomerase [Paracoccus denitrificans]QAR24970.1 2-hydroxychromene-2-carboxylate isomerase [Paracoccus denitrificans]UPV93851.1 2-hydroxychromene-2-carboxylate isomerase [Paracoccus denitrificans]
MNPIEFWFDFSSGYAFFAAQEIDALSSRVGRAVLWRPYMLGTAYKVTGARGLSSTPLKRDYARRDWARIAEPRGLSFHLPPEHPRVALAATRAFYWIETQNPDAASGFAKRIFEGYFSEGLDTSSPEAVAAFALEFGCKPEDLLAGIMDPVIKARTTELAEDAVARGVFGSPFFLVDGEPFWGWDRMGMMEDWIGAAGCQPLFSSARLSRTMRRGWPS